MDVTVSAAIRITLHRDTDHGAGNVKILFTGDVFLGGDLEGTDCQGAVSSDTFHGADIRVINLEQAISDIPETATKGTLYSDPSAINRLYQLNITSVNLANNHIHDKRDRGIIDTVQNLENAAIGHFGAGRDLADADEAYWVHDTICIRGYCDFGRPYLNKVQVAGSDTPGVNLLRYTQIMQGLDTLPPGKKAILFFHWGREHVWVPPYDNIELARKLLDDDRVLLIVGSHCHRIQGFIEHNGKRAYPSLGNFLFPNFFIRPPVQITHPDRTPEGCPITRQYHSVHKLTYKKWRLFNRVSLILEYDSKDQSIRHIPVIQDDTVPQVQEMRGLGKIVVLSWIEGLKMVYMLPRLAYIPVEKLNAFFATTVWNAGIMLFRIREMGIWYCGKAAVHRVLGNRGQDKQE